MVEETVGGAEGAAGADGEDAAAAAENECREASGVVTSPGIETTEGAAPLPPAGSGSVPAQLAAGSANSAPADLVIGTSSADTGSAGAAGVASDGSSAPAPPLALSPGLQSQGQVQVSGPVDATGTVLDMNSIPDISKALGDGHEQRGVGAEG